MDFKGYHFTPRLWPTVMTIPIVIILVMLGNWQMRRLDWKLGIIHRIESRYSQPAVNLPRNLKNPDTWNYRHVTVTGRFLYTREMPLYSIGPDGGPGYDLYTPLLIQGGKYLIVNRGWVPEKLKEQVSRPGTISSGQVKIGGVLRKSRQRQRFGPENDPEHNLWYYGDLSAMARAQDLADIYPMFLDADKSRAGDKYPVGGRTRIKIVNNHLDYALTWYGLAIVMLVIYLVFNTRKLDSAAKSD